MLLNDYPQLIFTTQEGNCFMPTQAEKECRRITSIMNNHEKQQALTENREFPIFILIYSAIRLLHCVMNLIWIQRL